MSRHRFIDALNTGGLVGDGAMGSLLYERGIYANRNFEQINLERPELVERIHRDYVTAGADVHWTNTFGANRVRLARAGLGENIVAINKAAVANARRAVGTGYLGGSMGPTGLPASELRRRHREVQAAYTEQAYLLEEAGCDLIVLETFNFITELQSALEAVRKIVRLPVLAQVVIGVDGKVSDGTEPVDLAREMQAWGADGVGVNCNGPDLIYEAAVAMAETGLPVAASPNAGRPRSIDDRMIYLATPENFGVYARRMFKAGVKLVGGCCGTGPEHIERVSASARMVVPREHRSVVVDLAEARPPPRRPAEQRSELGAKLGRRFVVSVEVNPGAGLEVEKPLEAARMLRDAGADVINIADGPRASVRMSNLALALRIREALDIDILLHLCTRDRNLLALQSSALGAHVLGIRNLVVITGDPPKVGDYPNATAVYDLDSIGLLKLLNGLNAGRDPAGKTLNDSTDFVLAAGAEPAAHDFDREIHRLRQKVAAGADTIMTQPVYDPAHLERYFRATEDLDIPVLVGILPLASYKNAAFLNTHVPGMDVPETILERMRRAGGGKAGRREGLAIATEVLHAIRDRAAGAYLMPPLGRYDMAAEILESLGSDRAVSPAAPGYRGSPDTPSVPCTG